MAEHINKTDTLNEGRVKLNEAINDSNIAKVKSESADVKATQALAKSTSTQTQLDTIVIDGDSSVEAAQARVDEKDVVHPTLKDRIDDGMNSVSSQLAQNEKDLSTSTQNFNVLANWFVSQLVSGDITKIKLIGDSITVGYSVPETGEDPNGRIIIDQGGVIKREAKRGAPSWANLFRNYIEENYPNVEFLNNGIGGWGLKTEGVTYRDQWIGTDNDVVFLMLGTNDRNDATDEVDFESYLVQFIDHILENSNHLVVMTPPPALNEFDNSGNKIRNLSTAQIDRVITKVCSDRKIPHFSFYREMLRYTSNSKIPLDQMFQTTGSHPLENGHVLMWKILQQRLGVTENVFNYENQVVDTADDEEIRIYSKKFDSSGDYRTSSTPITEYPSKSIEYHHISNAVAASAGFPEGRGGTLITYRLDGDAYAFQKYNIIYTNNVYRRHQLQGGAGWSVFELM